MNDNIEAPWVGNPPEEKERVVCKCKFCGEEIKAGNTYYRIPVEAYEGKFEYVTLCEECYKIHERLDLKQTAY